MKRVGRREEREKRGEIRENTISPDKYFNLLSLSRGARRVGGNWEGHVSLAMWVSTLENKSYPLPGRNGWRRGVR